MDTGNTPIWVQSDPATHFTLIDSNPVVAEEESIPMGSGGTFIKGGSESSGQIKFMLLSFVVKVAQAIPGTFDQDLRILFFHDSNFDNATLGTDSFIGDLAVAGSDWVATSTAGNFYFGDHDINMPYLDSEVSSTTGWPRLHVQIQPITGGASLLDADDTVMIQACLLPL